MQNPGTRESKGPATVPSAPGRRQRLAGTRHTGGVVSFLLAQPLLHGSRLSWFLVAVVAVGCLVAAAAIRSARRPPAKQPPPMTEPRLISREDDDRG